ncbi:uncharacterized protein LOC105445891 [Strongylocentrotus purpuratus]|uniref:Uncharacterized protein n=1 Tax=Strongylocentrotus purpuratus TaxID=7668 RepID=A0A7M7P5Y9_STRPU|nr:uncharacterized protein LOC105445891 [Strongylocentrotus purpuratus]
MGAAESHLPLPQQRRGSRRSSHCSFNDAECRLRKSYRKLPDVIDYGEDALDCQPKSSSMSSDMMGSALNFLADVEFPYENVVFEGGGSQGTAYIGAIMELERLGHLEKLRRFGGASVGSITAALLAVGHTSEKFLDVMKNGPFFNDALGELSSSYARCGPCSMVPNFLRHLGWHPGRSFYHWMGEVVEEKLGNPDATFRDLYEATGKELCVVVTNLSLKMEEYCHVKTTPLLPIRAAVRMSMAIPGVFFPFQWRYIDRTDVYVDGGVLCNYPVHCFDGWWLSMKPEDSFLRRLQPLNDVGKLLTKKVRFGTFNEKTLGFILFSDHDQHVLATNPALLPSPSPIPNTRLARAHQTFMKQHEMELRKHRIKTDAMTRFVKVLNDNNLDGNDNIDIGEFRRACAQTNEFTSYHARALFGDRLMSATEMFELLDINKDGRLDYHELMNLAEWNGVGIQTHLIGAGRTDIKNPTDLITSLFQSLVMNVKRSFLESDDNERTVLINTVYMKCLDFDGDPEDWEFLVEQGRRALQAFLHLKRTLAENTGKDDTEKCNM